MSQQGITTEMSIGYTEFITLTKNRQYNILNNILKKGKEREKNLTIFFSKKYILNP